MQFLIEFVGGELVRGSIPVRQNQKRGSAINGLTEPPDT